MIGTPVSGTVPVEDLIAAAALVDSMEPQADGSVPCKFPWSPGYPWWHGWALRDAYLAGLEAGRKESLLTTRPHPA